MITRCLSLCVLALSLASSIACNRAAWQSVAQGAAAGAAGTTPSPPAAFLVFGGVGHKTFLGCLNCSEYGQSSIHNAYSYGSPYGQTIFNHYSEYGSAYSNESACNAYANDPPVIVDSDGRYYGRLTLNQYHPQIGVGVKFVEWLQGKVCE